MFLCLSLAVGAGDEGDAPTCLARTLQKLREAPYSACSLVRAAETWQRRPIPSKNIRVQWNFLPPLNNGEKGRSDPGQKAILLHLYSESLHHRMLFLMHD
eukprot:277286-Amphidinium_carterae.1